eukprot:gene7246-12930_t
MNQAMSRTNSLQCHAATDILVAVAPQHSLNYDTNKGLMQLKEVGQLHHVVPCDMPDIEPSSFMKPVYMEKNKMQQKQSLAEASLITSNNIGPNEPDVFWVSDSDFDQNNPTNDKTQGFFLKKGKNRREKSSEVFQKAPQCDILITDWEINDSDISFVAPQEVTKKDDSLQASGRKDQCSTVEGTRGKPLTGPSTLVESDNLVNNHESCTGNQFSSFKIMNCRVSKKEECIELSDESGNEHEDNPVTGNEGMHADNQTCNLIKNNLTWNRNDARLRGKKNVHISNSVTVDYLVSNDFIVGRHHDPRFNYSMFKAVSNRGHNGSEHVEHPSDTDDDSVEGFDDDTTISSSDNDVDVSESECIYIESDSDDNRNNVNDSDNTSIACTIPVGTLNSIGTNENLKPLHDKECVSYKDSLEKRKKMTKQDSPLQFINKSNYSKDVVNLISKSNVANGHFQQIRDVDKYNEYETTEKQNSKNDMISENISGLKLLSERKRAKGSTECLEINDYKDSEDGGSRVLLKKFNISPCKVVLSPCYNEIFERPTGVTKGIKRNLTNCFSEKDGYSLSLANDVSEKTLLESGRSLIALHLDDSDESKLSFSPEIEKVDETDAECCSADEKFADVPLKFAGRGRMHDCDPDHGQEKNSNLWGAVFQTAEMFKKSQIDETTVGVTQSRKSENHPPGNSQELQIEGDSWRKNKTLFLENNRDDCMFKKGLLKELLHDKGNGPLGGDEKFNFTLRSHPARNCTKEKADKNNDVCTYGLVDCNNFIALGEQNKHPKVERKRKFLQPQSEGRVLRKRQKMEPQPKMNFSNVIRDCVVMLKRVDPTLFAFSGRRKGSRRFQDESENFSENRKKRKVALTHEGIVRRRRQTTDLYCAQKESERYQKIKKANKDRKSEKTRLSFQRSLAYINKRIFNQNQLKSIFAWESWDDSKNVL